MKKENLSDKLILPTWEEMPDIGLYMDQVLVLMDKYIGRFLNEQNKEIFITPSMINNYVKHGIMPAPIGKKYSKEHLSYLVIICLMKQALPISSIKSIIEIELKNIDINSLYNKFCDIYINMLNSIIEKKNINIQIESQNDSLLKLGIISNICRVLSSEKILKYEKEKENNLEIKKDNKKEKKDKDKDKVKKAKKKK